MTVMNEAALRQIAEQDDTELMLDPTWAKRVASAAISAAPQAVVKPLDADDVIRELVAMPCETKVADDYEVGCCRTCRARSILSALTTPPAQAVGVPEGWKLVPVEPTPEMIGAWYRYKNGHHWPDDPAPEDTSDYGAYRAMLAASPTPPADAALIADDHARGCQGREYTCTCGYDAKVQKELADLKAELAKVDEYLDADAEVMLANNKRIFELEARATAAEAREKTLREALETADKAIAYYLRYLSGGEMRGSYDGKPERDALIKAGYVVRAALKGGE